MDLQHAIDRVSAEISEVGALIRSLSGRYEGVFALLGSELGVTLGRSETMADAARHAIAFADAAAATFRESYPKERLQCVLSPLCSRSAGRGCSYRGTYREDVHTH
jgi:NifB/MoaA-like Fe-S oxidoreductase